MDARCARLFLTEKLLRLSVRRIVRRAREISAEHDEAEHAVVAHVGGRRHDLVRNHVGREIVIQRVCICSAQGRRISSAPISAPLAVPIVKLVKIRAWPEPPEHWHVRDRFPLLALFEIPRRLRPSVQAEIDRRWHVARGSEQPAQFG